MPWYKPESENPNKHPFMPEDFPWIVSSAFLDGAIEITQQDLDALISSIDLTIYNQEIQKEQNLKRQQAQREFGELLIPQLIDSMGERNLTLIQNGTSVDIAALAQDNAGIKLLIETGALSTARYVCSLLRAKYPTHDDIYGFVMDEITSFLISKGYE